MTKLSVTHTETLFVVDLKFRFNWTSYILADKEPAEVHSRTDIWAKSNKLVGKEGKVFKWQDVTCTQHQVLRASPCPRMRGGCRGWMAGCQAGDCGWGPMLEALTPWPRVRLNPVDNREGAEVFKQRIDCFRRFLFKSTSILFWDLLADPLT